MQYNMIIRDIFKNIFKRTDTPVAVSPQPEPYVPTYPVLIFYDDIVQMAGAEEVDYPDVYFEEYLVFANCYCRPLPGRYLY